MRGIGIWTISAFCLTYRESFQANTFGSTKYICSTYGSCSFPPPFIMVASVLLREASRCFDLGIGRFYRWNPAWQPFSNIKGYHFSSLERTSSGLDYKSVFCRFSFRRWKVCANYQGYADRRDSQAANCNSEPHSNSTSSLIEPVVGQFAFSPKPDVAQNLNKGGKSPFCIQKCMINDGWQNRFLFEPELIKKQENA